MKISSYYSAVQHILSLLETHTIRDFQTLTSDEARVSYLSSLDYVQSTFRVNLPTSSEKSASEAKRYRQRGNELYKEGNLKEALAYYNSSVVFAPDHSTETAKEGGGGGGSSELALAYGNRSATLLQMKLYAECLEDIDRAIASRYPDQLLYKLFDRKGRCLLELNRKEEAGAAFGELLKAVKRAGLDDAQAKTIVENANEKIESCREPVAAEQPATGEDSAASAAAKATEVPTVTGNASGRYPSASEAFDVRYNPENGRYGVAAKDITVGDIVLVESPYVSVLSTELFAVRCFHCFRSLSVPVPCFRCTRARYCSERCRSVSWETYHRIECPTLEVLIASRTGSISQLALRTTIVTGLQRMLKYKRNPKSDMTEALQSLFTNSDGVYIGGYISVYSLLSHAEMRSTTDLLQYSILAVWLTMILHQTNLFASSDPEDDGGEGSIGVVGGIVLRFLQIISCNGIEISEMIIGDNLQKSHPTVIGLALYPTVSLLNHSCDPVLELVFYGNACALRAVQNIWTGQELAVDYGYIYYTTPKPERQAALRAQYFFDCQCIACVLDWGLRAQLRADIPVLRCEQCGEALEGTATEEDEALSACPDCGTPYSAVDTLEALYQSQSKADEAIQEARKYRIQRAIPVLEGHLTFMSRHLIQPWREYVTCMSILKQCYRMLGNRRRK